MNITPKRIRTGGRKRTVFCTSCVENPIPVKQCKNCQSIYEARLRANPEYRKRELELRREHYRKNRESELQKKTEWKKKHWDHVLSAERSRKDRVRYGEFASAHRALLNLRKLIKEKRNEQENEVHGN